VDVGPVQQAHAGLGAGREAADAFDGFVEELEPQGMGIGRVEHIEDVPPEDELSRSPDDVGPLVSGMDEPIEKVLPAVLLPRGDADVPAALVDGTEKGSPARCQDAPFFPPPGEGFAPLDGKGPVLHAVGRQGNLVQQKYPLSREKGLPVGAEQGRLFRVGKDDQGG